MRKLLGWTGLAIAIVIAACNGGGSGAGGGGAGGDGGGTACGEKPTQCPAGQTCWVGHSGSFECEPSGTGKEGDTCAPTIGQPTCGDALFCLQTKGSDSGVCTKLCDAGTNPCGNLLCTLIEVQGGAQTHVCH